MNKIHLYIVNLDALVCQCACIINTLHASSLDNYDFPRVENTSLFLAMSAIQRRNAHWTKPPESKNTSALPAL
jgi:hypothetical protein